MQIYSTPEWLVAVMFLRVLTWEGTAAWLFWRAFSVGITLWFAFILMDEFFIAFEVADLEKTHLLLSILQLVYLMAIELLPDG